MYDVVIVGGGVMGSATAYHLKRAEPSLSVAVFERDSTYEHASTVLSDGNVRVQFNLEENIRISQHTLEVLETFAEDLAIPSSTPQVKVRRQGNLFLVDSGGMSAAVAGLRKQQDLGCRVEWLEPNEISMRFPVYRSTGVVGATLGLDDGSVDPTAVLMGYRAKATHLGAEYFEAEVSELMAADGVMTGLRLASNEVVEAEEVINTAGAWSPALTAGIGVHLPVVPTVRTVYVVSTPFRARGLPSVFLPNGIYAMSEGEHTWLIGWSRPEDPTGFELQPAGRARFEDMIWPGLVEYLPSFDRLSVERSWAGLYAVNTLDGNAIVGEWPTVKGLYLATGFSGHGFQQAPAVGRYLAECVLGLPHELDLGRLGGRRVIEGHPLQEHVGRLI